MKKLLFTCFLQFSILFYLSSQPFVSQNLGISNESGQLNVNAAWIDVNQDGVLDLFNLGNPPVIYAHQGGNFIELSHNLSSFTFADGRYDLKDYDSDGDMDILVEQENKLYLCLNDGHLTFDIKELPITITRTDSSPIFWQDVDGDLDLDVIVSTIIYINDNEAYTRSIYSFPENVLQAYWADADNDGRMDALVAIGSLGFTDKELYFLHNTGDGNFWSGDGPLTNSFGEGGTIKWVDVNQDEFLDIVMASPSLSHPRCTILKSMFIETGTLTYDEVFSFNQVNNPSISVGDVNLDGLPDIVISGNNTSTQLYLNQSDDNSISFLSTDLNLLSTTNLGVNMVDYDGDLDLDIHYRGIIIDDFTDTRQLVDVILINNLPGSKVLPPVPDSRQTLINKYITLIWMGTRGFQYNVVIEQNGKAIMKASYTENGTLTYPADAHLLHVPGITLEGLKDGDYSWRVEAVDYAFRSSGFSDPLTFSVLPPPSNLKSTLVDLKTAKLDWTYANNTVSFAVFRRSGSESATEIAKVPAGQFTFTDTGLPVNQSFEYYVKAISSSGGYSMASNTISFYSSQYIEYPFSTYSPDLLSVNGLAGDFNNDDFLDLAFIGSMDYTWNTNALFLNKGQGEFNTNPALPVPEFTFPYQKLISVTDMDTDGDEDLVVLAGYDYSQQYIIVFLNQNGGFVKGYQSESLMGLSAEVKDLNQDGRPDLFIKHAIGYSNGNPFTYEVFYQTRDGNFSASPFNFSSETRNPSGYYLADINDDGFQDIFFNGINPSDSVVVFMNVNGRTFRKVPSFSLKLGYIRFLDADGDGVTDYITQTGLGPLEFHQGLGDWKFSGAVTLPGNGDYVEHVADLDLDGLPDLICINRNTNANLYILNNKGGGQFEQANFQFKTKAISNSSVITDLENDGDIDVIKLHSTYLPGQGLNSLFKNQIAALVDNQPPSVPGAVKASVFADYVYFQWSGSSDDRTPSKYLSYNLWVQDDQGKNWLHPETNASGSFHRKIGPGNASSKTFYTLNDLPAGTYSVKVQALDASFKPSAWSVVSTFTIIPGPTNLQVERVLLNKINLTWTQSNFAEQAVVVERKSTYSDYQVIAELEAGSEHFTDQGLAYNTLYTYRVYEKSGSLQTAPTSPANWNTNQWILQNTTFPNVCCLFDVGDFTQDGKMDLMINGSRISGGYATDQTNATFENAGGGTWVKKDISPTSIKYTSSLQFYDVTGDNQLDLLQNGQNTSSQAITEVLKNNGDKTFSPASNIFTTSGYSIQSFYDFDSDNDLDIFVLDNIGGRKLMENKNNGVYQHNSSGDLTCPYPYSCPAEAGSGDFDNDGDEDLLRYTPGYGYQLFLKTPTELKASTNFPASENARFNIMDVNNDGRLDLLVLVRDYMYINQKSQLYLNKGLSGNGDVLFQLIRDDFSNSVEVQAMHADVDHDGDDDIITISPRASIYTNQGDGTFSNYNYPEYTFGQTGTQLIDFDNDGDLDIYITGSSNFNYGSLPDDPKSKVLLNQTIVDGKGSVNLPPSTPQNLSYSQDSLGIHLHWTKAMDDHTPANGITYDVVLYSGGKAITNAFIDPVSGQARKLVPGKHLANALLNNLVVGNYTWKVQAVDQSFLRSPLSAAGNFTFLPPPPVFADTLIYRCGRTITLTAQGQGIEWYSDKSLTIKLASGSFHPTSSQNVFVVQNINGTKGIPKFARITIREKPYPPTSQGPNPVTYCEYDEGKWISVAASGIDLKWYSDANKTTLKSTGTYISVKATPSSYYVTQTISGCESDPLKVDIQPLIINGDLYYADQKIYSKEQNADYYWWSKNNHYLYGGTNSYVNYDGDSATYQVQILKGQCYKISSPYTMWKGKITAIKEPDEVSLFAYPNPANFGSEIQVSIPSSGVLSIYDSRGSILYTDHLQAPGVHKISLQNMETGIFILSFDDGENIQHWKLIVH